MICQKCGTSIGDGDRFCQGCGSEVVAAPQLQSSCLVCGHLMSENDAFCPNCGYSPNVVPPVVAPIVEEVLPVIPEPAVEEVVPVIPEPVVEEVLPVIQEPNWEELQQQVSLSKNCVNCNASIEEDAMFCENCGTRVEPMAQQPTPVMQQVEQPTYQVAQPAYQVEQQEQPVLSKKEAKALAKAEKKAAKKASWVGFTISFLIFIIVMAGFGVNGYFFWNYYQDHKAQQEDLEAEILDATESIDALNETLDAMESGESY